ncbi:MAG: pantothenate kinase [Clostridia bacterium]|nr:pantothenate kinase [Clostridia bacterium]
MDKEIIGIDIGGSTTKIVAFKKGKMLEPQVVRATDPLTSLYGAFGKFTAENEIDLENIEKIIMTGVGSSFSNRPIYGLTCEKANEFECIGKGGLYLSNLNEAIIISLGTGTAIVHAKKDGDKIITNYLGGTGVGGGTLVGLSKKFLRLENIEHIEDIASTGNLGNIDLKVSDISKSGNLSIANDMTASNFGKFSDLATEGDIALGLINMICETIAMLGIFAGRSVGVRDIVLTGNLSTIKQASDIFGNLNNIFDVNFMIPKNSQFATAIGAALNK